MKIALCAAQGLAFLHEEGPFQVKNFCFDPHKVNNETMHDIMFSSQF
jgi:hypothetical protein